MQKKFSLSILFLIFLLIVIFYRSPFIFINGRFFSLDLNYHLIINSLNLFEAFFYVDFGARYLNLISNISSIISSRFFQLYQAQYIAVYISLLIYIIILYLILFKKSELFTESYQKFIFALLVIISPVMSFEIWLNAINLQVYLGLLSLLILFIIPKNKLEKYIFISLLVVSGLSGIYACAMTPLFFLRFLRKKSYYNLISLIVLIACCLVQLILIFLSTSSNEVGATNSALSLVFTKYELISYVYNVFIRVFFGSTFPKFIFNLYDINLETVLTSKNLKTILFLISFCFIFLILIFLSLVIKNSLKIKENVILYLFLSLLILSFVVIIGGVSDSLHGRYSALNGLIVLLICLKIIEKTKNNLIKVFSIFLIICSIIFGTIDYRLKKYIYYLDCIECPDWNEEVKKYNLNKNYKLNAWPYHINR